MNIPTNKYLLIFCSILVSCSGDKDVKDSTNYETISKVAESIKKEINVIL